MTLIALVPALLPLIVGQNRMPPSGTSESSLRFGNYQTTLPPGWKSGRGRGAGVEVLNPDAERGSISVVVGERQTRARNMNDAMLGFLRGEIGRDRVGEHREGKQTKVKGFDHRFDWMRIESRGKPRFVAVGITEFRGTFVISVARSGDQAVFQRSLTNLERIFRSVEPAGRGGRL